MWAYALMEKHMEKEKCVSCKKETEVPTITHVDYRTFYMQGSGQLCKACWEEIYLGKNKTVE